MAIKMLACLLALRVAAQGASLASLDILDNLQELLLNPEAMGARMKRSTSDNWDKEFVLDVVGIAFQLKYVDPSNPLKGGHANIKFPVKKFITGAPFDDMDLDIEFHGGDSPRDGLFDMTIKYKFVEKFTFLADRPQEGKVMIHRKLEGGMWKSRMSVANSNRQPSPFFDVTIDSDRLTKFYATFKYDADNEWVLKIDRVPGQSITGVAVINGQEHKFIGTLDQAAKKLNVKIMSHGITHNVDFKLTTTGEWGLIVTGDVFGPIDFKLAVDQKFKKIDFVAKYKNKNYAFVKLTGDAVITPAMFNADIQTIVYLPSHSLFHKVVCMYGRGCFNKRQTHMKISVDRVNKNALINKFKVESTIKKDDVKVLDLTMDTMTTPYHFNVNAPYVLPRFFGDSTRKTIDATITHQKGQKLEIHTNCPEFETFLINTAGSKRTITLNGRELMVLDHTNGEKRVSQTMELASGEHLTTTVEWTKDSVKDNKATVAVEITPDRKFKGVVDWDFKNPMSSKVEFDVEGTNPTIGEYKITREGDWHFTNPTYILNWNGKTRFASGPLAVMSPMDTHIHLNFNKNQKTLDAEMVETIKGKKYGVTVSKNKFSMLAGRA